MGRIRNRVPVRVRCVDDPEIAGRIRNRVPRRVVVVDELPDDGSVSNLVPMNVIEVDDPQEIDNAEPINVFPVDYADESWQVSNAEPVLVYVESGSLCGADFHAFGATAGGVLKGLVRGDGALTFARGSDARITTFEGLVRTCLEHELRFLYGRPVESLVSASEDFSGWDTSNASVSGNTVTASGANGTLTDAFTAIAADYVYSCKLKRVTGTGNVQIAADDGSWTTVTLTGAYQRFSVQQTLAAGSKNYGIRIVISGDEVDIDEAQLELVAGQANQNPSEYVSVGVATGAEESPDVSFDDPGEWTATGNWVVSGGEASIDGAGAGFCYLPSFPLIAGKTYVITYEVSDYTSGEVRFFAAGGINGIARSALGIYSEAFVANGTANLGITTGATVLNGAVAWYSIKEADHGAFVDGVRYYEDTNSLVVTDNVVGEALVYTWGTIEPPISGTSVWVDEDRQWVRLIEDTTNNGSEFGKIDVPDVYIADDTLAVWQCSFKGLGGGHNFRLSLFTKAFSDANLDVDADTGLELAFSDTSGVVQSYGIVDDGDDWHTLWMVFDSESGVGEIDCYAYALVCDPGCTTQHNWEPDRPAIGIRDPYLYEGTVPIISDAANFTGNDWRALFEPLAENECLYSEDLSDATWVASNVTKSSDGVDLPNGLAGTAETLTASAGNGTLLQAITLADQVNCFSVYLQRKTGTGDIDITLDDGSTWTTKALTGVGTWDRVDVTGASAANPDVGIRIVTSGDAVQMTMCQLEAGTIPTTYTGETTSGSVTRTADDGSSMFAYSNWSQTEGTWYADAWTAKLGIAYSIISLADSASINVLQRTGGDKVANNDGTSAVSSDDTFVDTGRHRMGSDFSTSDDSRYAFLRDVDGSGVMDFSSEGSYDGAFVAGAAAINIAYSITAPLGLRDLYGYTSRKGVTWIEDTL